VTHEDTPRVPAQRTSAGGCIMPVDVRVVVCPGLSVSVPARLRYDAADPYAVHLDNHIDLGTPITWVFARELLATGLEEWAGTGSVSVYPGAGGNHDTVYICLRGDEATVVLRAPGSRIRAFLAHTERIVPYGAEHRHLDLDTLLRRLRDGERPEPEL